LRAGAPNIEGLGTLSVRWYNPPDTSTNSNVEPVADETVNGTVNGEQDSILTDTVGWTAKRPVRGAVEDGDEEWGVGDDEDEGGGRRRR